jgi:hypothetical protein
VRDVSAVPDYDVDKAMSTEGRLIDTHCHLDFIWRKLALKVVFTVVITLKYTIIVESFVNLLQRLIVFKPAPMQIFQSVTSLSVSRN